MERNHRASSIGRWLVVGALALGGAAAPVASWAQDAPQQSEADAVTARARIQKIDKKSRTVTLNDMKGKTLDIQVGPSVDLDALKVGDLVQATYYESVAVAIRTPGERTSPNEMPGATERMVERPGATVRQTTVNARVTSVDLKNDTVTLDMPRGGMRSVHVKDPAVRARLGNLKPGSMVDITYTQASAIAVQPTR
jgi:Cu/Ag efflux protein CusF